MGMLVDTAPPRIFIIQSALRDRFGQTLVLDLFQAGDGTLLLGLAPLKDPVSDPTAATQRFRVDIAGRVQNEYLSLIRGIQDGYLERESMGPASTRIIFGPMDPNGEAGVQGWNFFPGPVPDPTDPSIPGAGPSGSERYTIISEPLLDGGVDLPSGQITALKRVLRAPSAMQSGVTVGSARQPVVAVPPPPVLPALNRLDNESLFYFNYIEGHE